ncbi:hypothetical protein FHS10_004348 [Mucilaginibacter dorajii]|nr:hypothetical protein [Mucilaginibacter dorajii]
MYVQIMKNRMKIFTTSLRAVKSVASEGKHDVNWVQTTHPDEASPVGPLSNFVAKRAKKAFSTLFAAQPERGWSSEA